MCISSDESQQFRNVCGSPLASVLIQCECVIHHGMAQYVDHILLHNVAVSFTDRDGE